MGSREKRDSLSRQAREYPRNVLHPLQSQQQGARIWRQCLHVTENHLYFVNASDQCIYKVALDQETEPQAISQPGPWRYADIIFDGAHRRLMWSAKNTGSRVSGEFSLA